MSSDVWSPSYHIWILHSSWLPQCCSNRVWIIANYTIPDSRKSPLGESVNSPMTFCGVWLSKYGSAQYRTQSQSRFSAVCVAGERTEGGTLIERLPHDWLPLNIAVYSSLVSPSDYSVVPYWWWSSEDVFYPQQCGSIHRWTFHCYKYECVCSVYKGSCKHALLTTQNMWPWEQLGYTIVWMWFLTQSFTMYTFWLKCFHGYGHVTMANRSACMTRSWMTMFLVVFDIQDKWGVINDYHLQ